MIQNVKRLSSPKRIRGCWQYGDSCQALELELPPGFDVFWGEAIGNPNGRPLGVLIVRGWAATARITARFPYS